MQQEYDWNVRFRLSPRIRVLAKGICEARGESISEFPTRVVLQELGTLSYFSPKQKKLRRFPVVKELTAQ
jgi:hypothetical protein